MKKIYCLLFFLLFTLLSYSQPGAALDFDSFDDNVILNSGPNISSSFTVEAWVKPNNFFNTMHIVSTRDSGDFSFDIQIKSGNIIHADIGNGTSWMNTSADANYNYTHGNWFHIAYVVNPTSYTIYVNGNPIGTGTLSGTPLLMNSTHKLVLGKNTSESTFYEGKMDEVRVWNRALTKCEIQNNLNFELASGQSGLSIYYKFNQGFASSNNFSIATLNDSSGNNYNASLLNFELGGGFFGDNTVSNWVAPGGVTSNNTTPAHVPLVVSSPQNFNMSATVANLTATGTAIKWYNVATGGTTLATSTPLSTGTFFVTQTTSGCESERTPVNVVIATPNVNSFSPIAGKTGDVIILSGSNFNTTTTNNIVFFGATKATVILASATSLSVTVPSGATYAPISVMNTATNLIAYSKLNFTPTYTPSKTGITANDFLPKIDFTTGNGSNPNATAIGDLDGDGKSDLVVVNAGTNTISIFRNTTTTGSIVSGSFAAKVEFTTGLFPRAIAIADIDGDGKLDLAVANYNSNTVSVLRNTTTTGFITTASFAPKVDFATGSMPRSVAIADLDADGKLDLAVSNDSGASVSILRNTATSGSIVSGSFAVKVDFVSVSNPCSVAIGDLDGDGKLDLVVASANSSTVSVLRNTTSIGTITTASFANKVDFATTGNLNSLIIADFDGDGKLDLAVVNSNGDTASVFRNTATIGAITVGSFAIKVDFGIVSSPTSIAVSDFDGDGKPDLAVASSFNIVSILRNTATSGAISANSFAPKVDFIAQNSPRGLAVGDLDNDGKPDFIFANTGDNSISIYRNANNNANLSVLSTLAGTINPTFSTATLNYSTNVPYTTTSTTVTPTKNDANATITVNGAAVNSGFASNTLNLNVGSNTITIVVTAQNETTKTYTISVTRAPFPPVITSFSPISGVVGSTVTITGNYFNTTPSNNILFFGATKATVTASTTTSLTVIVPTGATYAPLSFLNTGTALACYSLQNFTPIYSPAKSNLTISDFTAKIDFVAGSQPSSVAIGDLDGDGSVDMAVTNPNSNTVSVYRNMAISGSIGTGSFANKVDFATGAIPNSVTIGDLNADGKLDLAVTNLLGSSVSIYNNTSTSGAITAGSFAAKVDFTAGLNPHSVAIGDLDGDGKPDLAIADYGTAKVYVLRNTATSGAITNSSFANSVNFGAGTNPYFVVIGDLDGDGKPELAVANYGSSTVSIYNNTSTIGAITAGSFATKVDFATDLNPYSVAIGDLDGDGKPDLVTSNYNSNNVSIFRNTATSGTITTSSFALRVNFGTGLAPRSVAIGDLDGDGKPDLATANYSVDTVSILRNTASGTITTGSFATKIDFVTGATPTSVAIGDFDNDGKPDLAVTSRQDNNVAIFRNTNNNNNLSALSTNSGSLNPNFSASTTAYSLIVSNATSTVTITPTKADAGATITVNGTTVNSGVASGNIALAIGSNTITVVVTAQNGITKTYTITIIRPNLMDNIGLTSATPAKTAYSLRKLSSNYNGFAIKVRRSSDNSLLDIGFDASGGLNIANLNAFVGSSNAFVTKWYDQSGNGNDVVQTNIILQPRIVNAGIIEKLNNKPALYFGTSNLATTKTTLFSNATSMVGFAKGNSSTSSAFVTKTGTSSDVNNNYPAPFDFTNSGAEFYVGNASTSVASNINIASATPRADVSITVPASVYSFVIPSSGTFYSYLNGLQSGSASISAYADNGNAMQIGNRNDGSSSGNFWTTELVLFDSVLSTTDRQIVETSQTNFYNSNNADLSNLTDSSNALNPVFDALTTNYTVSVIATTGTYSVIPTTSNANATITVNGIAVTNGISSGNIVLNEGINTVSIIVTAQNATTKTYTLTVCREILPIFTAIASICPGSILILPTTSNNSITGTWSPAANNLATTTYTFTPAAEQCASTSQMTVAVGTTTTWSVTNGIGSWSSAAPISTSKAIISGNYSEAINLTACSIEITGTAIVIVPTGFAYNISGKVTVAATASLTFENNSNLIQISNVQNQGNIIVKRNASMRRQDYVYWGSPVAGQFLKAFSPETLNNRFYTYNQATNGFDVVANPVTTLFSTGIGNVIRAPNNFPLYNLVTASPVFNGTFNGVPHNGDYAIPVGYSGAGFGYNLLSNPYPSTLDATSFLATNPGTLYFWTHTAQGSNVGTNYASFNSTGATKATAIVPNVGSFESETPNGTIQIGQGFVYKPNATGFANFNNSMRTSNFSNQFFRNTNVVEKNRIWLRLTGAETSNQILLGYLTGATNEIDASIDGLQIATGNAISSLIGTEKYVIQGRSLPFETTDVVPLHLKVETTGTFTINIDEVDGLFLEDQNIYLKDNLLNITHNIKENLYTFVSEVGEIDNRFEIIYQDATLEISNPTFNENSIIVYEKDNLLNIDSGKMKMKKIQIFDVRGRLVFEKDNINNTSFLTLLTIEQQVLIVKIKAENGIVISKKIIN